MKVQSEQEFTGKEEAAIQTTTRASLVRKVYALLGVMMFLSGSLVSVVVFEPVTRSFITDNPALLVLSVISCVVCTCCLFHLKERYPHNLVIMVCIILFESHVLGFVCAIYTKEQLGSLIVFAFVAASCLFCALSLLATLVRINVGMSALLTASFCMIFLCTVSLLVNVPIINSLLAVAGLFLYSVFVLHDTSTLINHAHPDDAIIIVIHLYLDFVNVFVSLLQLLVTCES